MRRWITLLSRFREQCRPAKRLRFQHPRRVQMKSKFLLSTFAAALVLCAGPAFPQLKATVTGVPEIPITSVPNFLKVPDGEYLGESVAVATNSKGFIYVFHRGAP